MPLAKRRNPNSPGVVIPERPRPAWERRLCALMYLMGFFGFHVLLFVSVGLGLPSRFTTIPVRGLVLGLSLVALLLWWSKGWMIYRGRMWIVISGFWLLYACRIFLEWMFPQHLGSVQDYVIFGYGVCFFPMLGFLACFSRQAMRWAFWAVVTGGFAACLLSAVIYRSLFSGHFGRIKAGQVVDEFAAVSPLTLSYMGSVFIVLGVYVLFERTVVRKGFARLVLPLAMIAFGSVPLLLGASRGSLLAIAFACAVLMLSRMNTLRNMAPLVLGGILMAGFSFWLYTSATDIGSNLISRTLSIGSDIQMQSSGTVRLLMYQSAIEQFLSNPLLGSGLVVYPFMAYPHNLILESFMATGIVGGLLFCCFIFTCLWRAVLLLRSGAETGWVAMLFLHYFTFAQVSSSIATNSYFWVSGAAVLAAYAAIKQRPVHFSRPARQASRTNENRHSHLS